MANSLEAELAKGVDLNAAILNVLQKIMQEHGVVVFGGNGYSSEWHKMAVEERGLANLRTTADALPVLKEEYVKDLFNKTGVLSPVELESRFEVYAEQYIKSIEVEAKLVVSMAKTMIYPAAMGYLSELTSTINNLAGLGIESDKSEIKTIAELCQSLMTNVSSLSAAIESHDFASTEEHMQFCAQTILPLMTEIRKYGDALEGEVADTHWPLPTYQEMLFIK
jgi:glutamine synthetase